MYSGLVIDMSSFPAVFTLNFSVLGFGFAVFDLIRMQQLQ